MSEWVSVEERLPEVNVFGSRRAIVYDQVCGQLVGYLDVTGSWRDGFSGTNLPDVTHWQPLLAPPEEASDEQP